MWLLVLTAGEQLLTRVGNLRFGTVDVDVVLDGLDYNAVLETVRCCSVTKSCLTLVTARSLRGVHCPLCAGLHACGRACCQYRERSLVLLVAAEYCMNVYDFLEGAQMKRCRDPRCSPRGCLFVRVICRCIYRAPQAC